MRKISDDELREIVANLAISQAKTDEKLDKLAISQAKTDEQMAKTDEKLDKLAISQAKTDEKLDKLAISQAKTDEQIAKTDEQLTKSDEKLNRLADHFGGFSRNEGQIIEDRYYRSFKNTIKEEGSIHIDGIAYDQIGKNFKAETKKISGQYDIILFNSNIILLIDVKRKVHSGDIAKLLNHKETFPKLFKEYKNFDICLGLACDLFYDELIQLSKDNSIYLFQERSGIVDLIDDVSK